MRGSLASLAAHYGIQRSYRAANGEMVRASEAAVRGVLAALGVAADGSVEEILQHEEAHAWLQTIDPVVLAWNTQLADLRLRLSSEAARRALQFEIRMENGDVVSGSIPVRARRILRRADARVASKLELSVALAQPVPFGYHELHLESADGAASALIVSAPRRCYAGDRPREWGVFAPLYGIRESADQAIGELNDLASLMRWIAERDGDFVATLPISAAFLREPFDPSPYAPASRLFWNELYLNVPGVQASPAAAQPLVDYRCSAHQKRAALEPQAGEFFAAGGQRTAGYREFLKLYPAARDYAAFRAAGEAFGAGWGAWPERPRAGRLMPSDYTAAGMQYHLYAQYCAHRQLSALAADARRLGVRLYLDMPLGVHPDSYDIWRHRDLFVTGAAAGAPPDPFFTNGQNWGFPPLHPQKLREHRYGYWRSVLQTQLRYAGRLRLDHVMALHRLYIVPAGMAARDGAYVRYPAAELFAILALESQRHRAAIVGEDLGTVPAEVRKSMVRHGVKRMFVVQFEATADADQPLGGVPAEAVASLNTHDMPPFRTYWEARDADLRRELGLIDDDGVAELKQSRARTAQALSRLVGAETTLETRAAHDALIAFLARSPADMVLLNLEDVWLESEPQNVPGTSHERPNWRRRLNLTLEQLRKDHRVRDVLDMVERARRAPNGSS